MGSNVLTPAGATHVWLRVIVSTHEEGSEAGAQQIDGGPAVEWTQLKRPPLRTDVRLVVCLFVAASVFGVAYYALPLIVR
jgi:hypothetical protein